MDSSKKLPTLLSFCTGYGGIERGIESVFGQIRVLAHVEIEAYAVENLVAKMESGEMVPAPIWTNVKTFPVQLFRGKVDILTAGYPCQPFSVAGKREGAEDPRHLWPYIREAISVIRPSFCFFENVEGHISLGLREVLADLVGLGYRVESDNKEPTWGIFSAAEVGAPHQRKRVFIMGYHNSAVRYGKGWIKWEQGYIPVGGSKKELGDSASIRLCRYSENTREACSDKNREKCRLYELKRTSVLPGHELFSQWPSRPGEPQYEWEPPRTI